MAYQHTVAPSRWIVLLLVAFACPSASSATSSPLQQALAAVEDCLAASPPAWPHAWCIEYVDAIRDASTVSEEPSDYALRLNALAEAFPWYWEDVTTSRDRALFELQCAEIKWYAGHLVNSAFPGEEDRGAIRKQVKDLWQDAADSLIAQFPFLDPNIVCKARADHLQRCLRWVDAPLKPIFQRPFTLDQMDRIREGWHELRYARVDLMRQLGGEDVFGASGPREAALSAHPHYLLTYRSLQQLDSFIWTLVARPPEHYVKAQQNYRKARQRQRQRTRTARAQEQRLGTERSRQLRQTEYLSFLLAVVLESAQPPGRPPAEGLSDGFHERVEAAPPKEVRPRWLYWAITPEACGRSRRVACPNPPGLHIRRTC
jgi:hypothetical protein